MAKQDMLGILGSLGSGMADFGMGNFVSLLNFVQELRGAHHSRLVGNKVAQRNQAFLANDPNWFDVPTAVSPDEDMRAVMHDLLPFGLGDALSQFAYPGTPPQGSK